MHSPFRSNHARHSFAVAFVFAALVTPAQAVGPLAFLAKDILSGIVRSFVQSQLKSLIRATLGPCKSLLADMGVGAVGTIQGLASAASGARGLSLPGVPALPSLPSLPTNMPGAAGSTVSGLLSSAGGTPQVAAAMQGMLGGTAMQGIPGGAAIPGLANATPLSSDETDELVDKLVMLSKAMPDQPLPCSPGDLKLVFRMTASVPMVSGSFRTMLDSLRTMDQQFVELRQTFAKMSAAEQNEAIDLMLADLPSLDAENRKAFANFARSDLLALPAAARTRLVNRLGAAN